MYLVFTHVHFQYHVLRRDVLVVNFEANFWVYVRQYFFYEVVIDYVGEFIILVRNFTALTVEEILLNKFGNLFLLIFDI